MRPRQEPIPRDGWGNAVSDVRFLVELVEFFDNGREEWEPEDTAVFQRIKEENNINT